MAANFLLGAYENHDFYCDWTSNPNFWIRFNSEAEFFCFDLGSHYGFHNVIEKVNPANA